MVESNLNRFVSEAKECVRRAEMAINSFDKEAWLQLAEDWMKLARAAKELDAW